MPRRTGNKRNRRGRRKQYGSDDAALVSRGRVGGGVDLRPLSVALPDTLTLSYVAKFNIGFPPAGSSSRYFVLQGGAFRSELTGVGSSLTLPTSAYFSSMVV